MFEFLTIVFNKVVSLVTIVVVALGLVSAPVPLAEDEAIKAEVQRIEEQLNPTANLKDAVSPDDPLKAAIEDIEKQLEASASEPVKKSEPKAAAQVIETLMPGEPIATSPSPAPSQTKTLSTFTLPSGVVVDENGNPISSSGGVSAPVVATPSPAQTQALPSGYSQLLNGKYLDPYGAVVDKIPDYAYVQAQQPQGIGYEALPTGWTQLQSGLYRGPNGELTWEKPK